VTFSDGGTYGGVASGGTFTLRGGELKTFTGIPADVTYEVTEVNANTNGYITTSTGAVGTITAGGTSEAVFTNTRIKPPGSLTVRKVLSGNDTEATRDFTFTVTFGDDGTYGGVASGDTFTLKGGSNRNFADIPDGVTYVVTENDANANRYSTTSTGAAGTITAEEPSSAVFTNTRNRPLFVPVTDIINVPGEAALGTPLALTATVLPVNATNQNITWKVKDAGFTGAVINGSVLTAAAAGTVVVTASIDNGVAIGTAYNKDFIITVNAAAKYNYNVFLQPAQTTLNPGDTLLVDIILIGDINYTQLATEIVYDTSLLQYAGYANLAGFAGAVTAAAPNKISVRSVPSLNMVIGAPSSPNVKIVTLKFTVTNNFAGNSATADLSFASVAVSPPSGFTAATTAPSKAVTFTFVK
jgi:hypothetical protein